MRDWRGRFGGPRAGGVQSVRVGETVSAKAVCSTGSMFGNRQTVGRKSARRRARFQS